MIGYNSRAVRSRRPGENAVAEGTAMPWFCLSGCECGRVEKSPGLFWHVPRNAMRGKEPATESLGAVSNFCRSDRGKRPSALIEEPGDEPAGPVITGDLPSGDCVESKRGVDIPTAEK